MSLTDEAELKEPSIDTEKDSIDYEDAERTECGEINLRRQESRFGNTFYRPKTKTIY